MDFLSRYKELGQIFDPETVNIKPSIRINTLKINEQELMKRLKANKIKLEKIKFLEHGYFYESNFSLGSTPEYLQGYYYLQDAASQLCVQILNPKPGEKILDMASAPGGKTTHISQLMQGKGIIIALDENETRLKSVINNAERLNTENIIFIRKDARYSEDIKIEFDKILLDAPCSGNFCVEKNYFKRTKADIDSRVRIQKELLRSAYFSLKKEGTIIYSTCSLEPEENELIINWFVKEFDVKIEKINVKEGDPGITNIFGQKLDQTIAYTKRFWPHKEKTNGFYIAKIKKN